MHKHNLDKLNIWLKAEQIEANLGKRTPNFRKVLNKYFSDKIALIWTVDDIIWRGEEKGVNISNKQASVILAEMFRDHDANIGFNWEVIDAKISDVMTEKLIVEIDKITKKITKKK
jgi:hypothetical protein